MIKSLKERLKEFADSRKNYGNAHTMAGADFDYAVRWIFMRWLMKDVNGKNDTLKHIKPGLDKLEIPFNAWLIEYDNHLFDSDWLLCLEPSLTSKIMRELAQKLYDLRAGILGADDRIPWKSLAAAVREPNMERVKIGTERLSNLLRIHSHLELSQQRKLHFGHFLLANLRSADPSSKEVHTDRLETSYSAWRLTPGKADNPAKAVAKLLECVRETGGGNNK